MSRYQEKLHALAMVTLDSIKPAPLFVPAIPCVAVCSINATVEELAAVINQLGDRERLVLSLFYFEQFTLPEISGVLDLNEKHVVCLLRSALQKLQLKGCSQSPSAAGV